MKQAGGNGPARADLVRVETIGARGWMTRDGLTRFLRTSGMDNGQDGWWITQVREHPDELWLTLDDDCLTLTEARQAVGV